MSAPSRSTPTGIPIIDCTTCGRTHPETHSHCVACGSPSLFPHHMHSPDRQDVLDLGATR